jgi:hypothetical protein
LKITTCGAIAGRSGSGFLLSRALEVTKGGWRDWYRDSRNLSETTREVLGRHLPLM